MTEVRNISRTEIQNSQLISNISFNTVYKLPKQYSAYTQLAIHPNFPIFYCLMISYENRLDYMVIGVDISTNNEIMRKSLVLPIDENHIRKACLVVSPNGKNLAIFVDNVVQVLDLETNEIIIEKTFTYQYNCQFTWINNDYLCVSNIKSFTIFKIDNSYTETYEIPIDIFHVNYLNTKVLLEYRSIAKGQNRTFLEYDIKNHKLLFDTPLIKYLNKLSKRIYKIVVSDKYDCIVIRYKEKNILECIFGTKEKKPIKCIDWLGNEIYDFSENIVKLNNIEGNCKDSIKIIGNKICINYYVDSSNDYMMIFDLETKSLLAEIDYINDYCFNLGENNLGFLSMENHVVILDISSKNPQDWKVKYRTNSLGFSKIIEILEFKNSYVSNNKLIWFDIPSMTILSLPF